MVDLANNLSIELTEGNFCETTNFQPFATSRDGIFVCGAFQGPKDIPESVMEASAAACSTGVNLSPARGSLVKEQEFPEESDISGQEPRIGVFVCNCGVNIGGTNMWKKTSLLAAKILRTRWSRLSKSRN